MGKLTVSVLIRTQFEWLLDSKLTRQSPSLVDFQLSYKFANTSSHLVDRARPGFASFTLEPQFRAYVNYVIEPSYQVHREMGLLQYTMSGVKLEEPMPFRNFLSGRILWDEAMASNAYEWTRKNKGGLLVGIVGADHGKHNENIKD